MNTDPNSINGSTEFLNFSDALHHLRWGEKVARRSWPEDTWLEIVYGHNETRLWKIEGLGTNRWVHGIDLIAEDWYVV